MRSFLFYFRIKGVILVRVEIKNEWKFYKKSSIFFKSVFFELFIVT